MWFELKGDDRLRECATDGCGGQPTWRLEAGGAGSNYCSGCKEKIEPSAKSTGVLTFRTAREIERERLAGKALACAGVGRDAENEQSLSFIFSRRPTDDEMRFLHDVMKRAVASAPK